MTEEKFGFWKNQIGKIPMLLIVLSFLIIPLKSYSYSSFWNNLGSGEMSEGTGSSLGQTANMRVAGRDDIGDGTYGFWQPNTIPQICFSITPNSWDIDTINLGDTKSMTIGEQMMIFNCGNCKVDFGLVYIECTPIDWGTGVWPDRDIFAMRARFTREESPPSLYHALFDFVSGEIIWANSINYGTNGKDVNPMNSRYLWFQFTAPTISTSFGDNTIHVDLLARINLP